MNIEKLHISTSGNAGNSHFYMQNFDMLFWTCWFTYCFRYHWL